MKFVIQTLLYSTIILISKAGFDPNVGDYCNENNNQCDAANGIFWYYDDYSDALCVCLNEEGYSLTEQTTSQCCANLGSLKFYEGYNIVVKV